MNVNAQSKQVSVIPSNMEEYQEIYQRSLSDPEGFYGQLAQELLAWHVQPSAPIVSGDFSQGDVQWFGGGKLNVAFNCVDRHAASQPQATAILWESDDGEEQRRISYLELFQEVCRFANALKASGVKKGDRVCIYMPMVPEVAFAMLACTRIGAIHSVVFAGFSPQALRERVLDAQCSVLITADEAVRGGQAVPLKVNADRALEGLDAVQSVIVVRRTGADVPWVVGRDQWWHELREKQSTEAPPELCDAEDPLFILYTSGSTGRPKGVLHTTAGYLVNAALSCQVLFQVKQPEVYWCTADVGWITGHTYVLYGPLCNGWARCV